MHLFPNVHRIHFFECTHCDKTPTNLATAFAPNTKAEIRSAIASCVNGQCVCACACVCVDVLWMIPVGLLFFSCLLCSPSDCIDCACAGPEPASIPIDDMRKKAKRASDVWSLLNVSIKHSRKVRGGNYVQLATADNKGNPACRTVVFRGFLDVGTAKRGTDMALVCGWLYLL